MRRQYKADNIGHKASELHFTSTITSLS